MPALPWIRRIQAIVIENTVIPNLSPAPPPTTPTVATVTWIDAIAQRHTAAAGPALLQEHLYEARPIRMSKPHKRSTAYQGHSFISQTRQQLWTESRLEAFALMWIDMSFNVESIATQPMRINFSDGTRHTPDIFALHSDATQVLYDVKPKAKLTEDTLTQFRKTREVCADIGWGYKVFHELAPQNHANMLWLWNFRRTDLIPSQEVEARVLELLDEPRTISSVAVESGLSIPDANTAIFNMLWRRILRTDLKTRIGYDSLIERTTHGQHN